ncbi:MAG: phosphate-starvation-inducible PsiE family protein [Betaproteobacteria bacterium]|nr:phosphate-starvation-inducible PsiE family protein [Betaproteobacteria bacterium]
MPKQLLTGDRLPKILMIGVKSRSILIYGKILDVVVAALIFLMLLTLVGAVIGLVFDFMDAVNSLRSTASTPLSLSHKLVDGAVQTLVTDVLSVFVLIELFHTFTDYLEFHRIRLRVLTEVGISFVLRDIFIGLYNNNMNWTEIVALSVLLAVLVTARIAAVQFHPSDDSIE